MESSTNQNYLRVCLIIYTSTPTEPSQAMTDDAEAYEFYAETELSELAYLIIEENRHFNPNFLVKADSHHLVELLRQYIEVPNPFLKNPEEEANSDDDYVED